MRRERLAIRDADYESRFSEYGRTNILKKQRDLLLECRYVLACDGFCQPVHNLRRGAASFFGPVDLLVRLLQFGSIDRLVELLARCIIS